MSFTIRHVPRSARRRKERECPHPRPSPRFGYALGSIITCDQCGRAYKLIRTDGMVSRQWHTWKRTPRHDVRMGQAQRSPGNVHPTTWGS